MSSWQAMSQTREPANIASPLRLKEGNANSARIWGKIRTRRGERLGALRNVLTADCMGMRV